MEPLIMAHAGGKGHGRENSVEAIQKVIPFKPDIIELDVHKSKDGVLFCYHGSIPFGFLLSFFVGYFKFTRLQDWLQVDKLSTVVKAISYEPILFLDIWQNNITATDLRTSLVDFPSQNIWIASRSLQYIQSLKKELDEVTQYIFNRGIFFPRPFEIFKLKGVSVVKLFFWQCKTDIFDALKKQDCKFALSSFLLTRKKYNKLSKEYNSLWICHDTIPKSKHTYIIRT